jgi:signal transduction histidine kinase
MEDADRPIPLGADTAHELANLMMVVSGSLEQLRRQPFDERGQQQLARAEWGVRQAAQLTRQVLSQARGEDGTAKVVDLNAVVGEFAAVMGQQAGQGVQLTAQLVPAPLPVRLDASLLELVLLNLVRNAADAMPDGGQVVLRTKGPQLDGLGDQLAAEVAVSDTGTGMAPDVTQRAAEAFFTTKPNGKGTGLGLWMAHRFASTHDGKISIETAPGQGTTVRLALPCADDGEQS